MLLGLAALTNAFEVMFDRVRYVELVVLRASRKSLESAARPWRAGDDSWLRSAFSPHHLFCML